MDGLSDSSSSSSSLSSPQNSPIDPYAKLAPHEKQLREREDAFYFAGLHMNGGDEGGAKNQLGAAVDAIDEYESSIDSMSNLDKMAFLLNSKVGGLSLSLESEKKRDFWEQIFNLERDNQSNYFLISHFLNSLNLSLRQSALKQNT